MGRVMVQETGDRWRRRGGPGGRATLAGARGLAAVLATLLLAGCSGAQSTVSSTIRPLTEVTGFSTKVDPPKDFVTATRPAQTDYVPVGVTPPARKQTVLTPAELATATEQLEATRAGHDKLAGRKPPVEKPKGNKPGDKKPDDKKQGEKPAPSL